MFTLDQVRGFVAVADELHFGRAAERLQMTQPPLSRQIQRLEREVGARLLDRDQRSVALTAAGEAFLVDARRLLATADAARVRARRIDAGAAGLVRLAFTANAAGEVLPAVLAEAASTLPDVQLDLVEMVSTDQVRALHEGAIDVGLARPPFGDGLVSEVIHREPLLLAVPAGHPLASADEIALADVVATPLIMYAPTTARYFHDLVMRLLPAPRPTVAHTVTQVLTMLSLVAGGRGVALVPASASRLQIAGVVLRELDELPPEPVELHLLTIAGGRNPAADALADVVRAAVRPPLSDVVD